MLSANLVSAGMSPGRYWQGTEISGGGERGVHTISRYTVITRMIVYSDGQRRKPFYSFIKCLGTRSKKGSINHNLRREQNASVRASVCENVRACVCACVRVCERVRESMRMCVCLGEREREMRCFIE